MLLAAEALAIPAGAAKILPVPTQSGIGGRKAKYNGCRIKQSPGGSTEVRHSLGRSMLSYALKRSKGQGRRMHRISSFFRSLLNQGLAHTRVWHSDKSALFQDFWLISAVWRARGRKQNSRKKNRTRQSRVETATLSEFWKHNAPNMRLVEIQCAHLKHCHPETRLGRHPTSLVDANRTKS